MADKASRDVNRVPSLIGVSSVDGKTPQVVEINPTSHEVLVKPSLPTNAATEDGNLGYLPNMDSGISSAVTALGNIYSDTSDIRNVLVLYYTQAIDYDASGNAIYIGLAIVGSAKSASVWQIRKITYDASNNATDIQWADGVITFIKIWNSRTSYSYA